MKPVAIFFSIFIIAGLIPLGIGVYDFLDTKAFLATAEEAEGTVTAHGEVTWGRHQAKKDHVSVVTFTAQGTEHTMNSERDPIHAPFAVGESLKVWYQSDNPTNARLDKELPDIKTYAFLAALAVMFIGVGILGIKNA